MSVLTDDKIAYSMGFANAHELREFIVWPTDFFDSVRAAIAADRAARAEPVALSRIQRTAPERIWLQVDPDIDAADTDFHDQDEVTWADDDIGENDVPYVRVDLAAPPAAPVVTTEEGRHCGDPDCVPCRDPAEPAGEQVGLTDAEVKEHFHHGSRTCKVSGPMNARDLAGIRQVIAAHEAKRNGGAA